MNKQSQFKPKKGQDILKNAILAQNKIPPRGVEPLKANQQPVDNKILTQNTNPVLSTSLDNLVQIYPDLAELVKLWPELPQETKKAIKTLIQTYKAENK